jgi:CHAD domain-containing protein
MSYRFRSEEAVRDGFRRSAREQLDQAIRELSEGIERDPVTAVHNARKALKKERSLLRLGRGTLAPGERRRENGAARDAARRLSGARDAEVMIQTLDDLSERYAGQGPKATFTAIRARLEADGTESRAVDAELTAEVAEALRWARDRTDSWRLRRGGWAAIEPGLVQSYQRGRIAMQRARRHPTPESLHDWRKRAKDLWYHLRILADTSPDIVGGYVKEAHQLADVLGDDHDLAVLSEAVVGQAGELAVDHEPVLELIDRRRSQLEAEAWLIGDRVYAEKPAAFAHRLARYWKAWRAEARVAAAPEPVAVD